MKTLTPADVKTLLDEGGVVLVDVREDHEWASARIADAVHAPLSRLAELADTLPGDKPVVFYCAGGVRSAKAVELAQSIGLDHDRHMGGGINAWFAQGLPIER